MIRNFIIIGLGGAIGSMLRFGCALLIGAKSFPLGILIINITGCFIIGAVMAYSMKNEAFDANWKLFLATGLCGGFTTFSAFSLDNLMLLENGKTALFLLNVVSSLLLGIAAVWMGFRVVNFVTE